MTPATPTPAELRLSHTFISLVVPNFPFVAGTTIPVIDAEACARRGTPEQRQTAKHVRSVLEDITELDEGHPARQLLERLRSPPSRAGDAPAPLASVTVGDTLPPLSVFRLPRELLLSILQQVITGRADGMDNQELVAFGHFRLVSRSISLYLEQLAPDVYQRYIDRVVMHLLHVVAPLKSLPSFAREVYGARQLLRRARTLRLFYIGSIGAEISEVLRGCDNLKELVFYHDPHDTPVLGALSALDTSTNTLLESLELRCFFEREWDEPWVAPSIADVDPRAFIRAWRTLGYYAGPTQLADHKPPRLPYLRQLRFVGTKMDPMGFGELVNIQRSGVKQVSVDDGWGGAYIPQLGKWRNITTLELIGGEGGRITSANVRSLMDYGATTLVDLDLSENEIDDAGAFGLGTNTVLRRLLVRANPLQSLSFGLASNSTLQHLDLSEWQSSDRLFNCRQLGAELSSNRSLRELVLDDCFLNDAGLAELQLAQNTGLRSLSLKSNRITKEGLAHVRGSAVIKVKLVGNEVSFGEAVEVLGTSVSCLFGQMD